MAGPAGDIAGSNGQGAPPWSREVQAVRISPLDIRKQTFKKSMRGVDTEEVRIFLELVASEYEKVLQENAMMAERMRHQEERLEEYRDLEKSMRNSLVTAERIASESRAASEREAQRIVQDANIRAERILEGARERLQGLIREIEALRGKREAFLRRFITLIQSQIGVVGEHASDMEEVESLRREVENLLSSPRSQAPAPDDGMESGEEILEDEPPLGSESQEYEPEPLPEARPRLAEEPVFGRLSPEFDQEPGMEEPEEQETGPRALPRGLGRLLRGRQGRLPLEAVPSPEDPEQVPEDEQEEEEAPAFFPARQRREGFFEISASEEEERSRTRRG